jgi:hypothetical protein
MLKAVGSTIKLVAADLLSLGGSAGWCWCWLGGSKKE